ncbi:hypothetical protein V6N12_007510 [Hibiscus sabdariffa]|uniref:Uncharacterized protein n=1 Tax=Hibiscus sabdariffa TaxID=183260 RepID=A0ABR2F1Z5_9ROSI
MPIVAVSHHSLLECPGFPVATIDQQVAKRGKASASVFDVDGSRSMDMDDQVLESSKALHPASRIGSMDQVSGSPKIPYVRVVAGANTLVVMESSPSLDDVIVHAGDVKVDRSGQFPSVYLSEQVHDCIDHSMCRSLIVCLLGHSISYKTLMGRIQASRSDSVQAPIHSEGHPEASRIEKEVYGPWMLAPSRYCQSRKDNNRSKGTYSIPGSSGGSHFAILGDNADTKLIPVGTRVELDTAARSQVAALQPNLRGVSESRSDRGAVVSPHGGADNVPLQEVASRVTKPVQMVTSSGSQVPRVESHVIGGRHVAPRRCVSDSLKANLKPCKGKENRPPLKLLLWDWLPPNPPTTSSSTADGGVDPVHPSLQADSGIGSLRSSGPSVVGQ